MTIYVHFEQVIPTTFSKRAEIRTRYPDLGLILKEEWDGKYIGRTRNEIYKRGEMLVMGEILQPLCILNDSDLHSFWICKIER
jgi:hypothetical protein